MERDIVSSDKCEIEIAPGVKMEFVLVAPGCFRMGSVDADADRDEQPVRDVTVGSGYLLAKYEVTQEQWNAVAEWDAAERAKAGKQEGGEKKAKAALVKCPSSFRGGRLPVESVSFDECRIFAKCVNRYLEKRGESVRVRLPSEVEWEFAAKGGVKGKGFKFSGSDDPDEVAWYDGNSGDMTHDVGTKKPNELGIYDMSGNVWEWCEEGVGRGGGWNNTPRGCRTTFRCRFMYRVPYLGFRLAADC